MHSGHLVLCSRSTKHHTALTRDVPNSSSGSDNSEDNAQIHADASLFLTVPSPAGSHQAKMIDYRLWGLF